MTYNSLSLGGGVQSSTLALMAAHGELHLPRLDSIIFADTHDETAETYEWLDQLNEWLIDLGSVAVTRVSAGGLLEHHLTSTRRTSQAPVFVHYRGTKGRVQRRCSRDFKVYPVRREVRKQMQAAGFRKLTQWVGISYDESDRMTTAGSPKYITTAWPLVERKITRDGCLEWLVDHDYPLPPRSACYWCPQASDARWIDMRTRLPHEFARAVDADAALRAHGIPGIEGVIYLHPSLEPLDQAIEAVAVKIRNAGTQLDLLDDFDRSDLTCAGGCFS